MKLNWIPSLRASALNFARQLVFNQAFATSHASTEARIVALDFQECAHLVNTHDPWAAWIDLVAASGNYLNAEKHVRHWLARCTGDIAGSGLAVSASQIQTLEIEFRRHFPQAENQLPYRLRPLTQQWDGYGNALLAHLRRLIGQPTSRSTFDVLAVYPLLNGDGFVSLNEKSIVVEAVLVNPSPELPEVIRLGWLVAQLLNAKNKNLDSETKRLQDISALALLPAILATGEIVELTRCDEATLQLALDQFSPARPDNPRLPEILLHWWETFLQTKPEWSIALTALDRALNFQSR